jgi:hypothetical protein
LRDAARRSPPRELISTYALRRGGEFPIRIALEQATESAPRKPIRPVDRLLAELDERLAAGFPGSVVERRENVAGPFLDHV